MGQSCQKSRARRERDTNLANQQGQRPPESNYRLDQESKLDDGRSEVILQANKNAQDASVKKSAQQDSHLILAKGLADPKNDSTGVSIEDQLRENFKDRKSK